MAKKGMARPDRTKKGPKNKQPPVPEIQGKAKRGHYKANIIIGGSPHGPQLMVFHGPSQQDEDPDPDP